MTDINGFLLCFHKLNWMLNYKTFDQTMSIKAKCDTSIKLYVFLSFLIFYSLYLSLRAIQEKRNSILWI